MPVKKKVAKLKIQEPEKSIRKEPPKVTIAKKKIPPIPEVKKKELPKSKEIREISKTKSSPLAPPSQKKIKKPGQPLNTAPPLFGISLSSTITKTNGVSLPGEKSGTHFNRPGRDAPRESGKFGDETTYQPFTPDQVDEMPVLLKEVRPKFPDEAKKSGWEGAVLLELSIDEEGQVTDVQILKGRYNVLNEAAKKAAFQFLFSPAKIKNKSIPVRIDYAVTFLLQN